MLQEIRITLMESDEIPEGTALMNLVNVAADSCKGLRRLEVGDSLKYAPKSRGLCYHTC